MTLLITQKKQEKVNAESSAESTKKGKLVATWVIENGELVCKWNII
jgi:hypothetical protein